MVKVNRTVCLQSKLLKGTLKFAHLNIVMKAVSTKVWAGFSCDQMGVVTSPRGWR